MDTRKTRTSEAYFAVKRMLSREELLAQTAEECAELAKAALKLRRVLDGTNPTPVSQEEAEANLQEEMSDVIGCMLLVDIDWEALEQMLPFKMQRWASRLERKGANDG